MSDYLKSFCYQRIDVYSKVQSFQIDQSEEQTLRTIYVDISTVRNNFFKRTTVVYLEIYLMG